MRLRVATRGSKLSLAQTREALDYLASRLGENLDYELVVVKTRGDIHQDKPFAMIGGKGLFEKEVNLAVLEGRADIAIHSLKDVPSEVHPDLVLAFTPPRGPAEDILVTRGGARSLWDLPSGAVIGTSSARRAAFLKAARSDITVKPLRGNVDTRLRKLQQGMYDAIVLAEAGIKRLGVELEYWRIPPEVIPPAPGQGIVAAYARRQDWGLVSRLLSASHGDTLLLARAERAFLALAGGGCHTPLGGYAVLEDGDLVLRAAVASADGSAVARVEARGDPERPAQVGVDAAFMLRREAEKRGIRL